MFLGKKLDMKKIYTSVSLKITLKGSFMGMLS